MEFKPNQFLNFPFNSVCRRFEIKITKGIGMKKTIIIWIAAILVLAGAAGFTVWKINDVKEKKELALLEDISSIQDDVNSLYADGQKTNLADHIDMNRIQQSQDLLGKYSGKELSAQATLLLKQASTDLSFAEKMFELKQSIGQLFDANGAIVQEADIDAHKGRLDALRTEKPNFADKMMVLILEAEAQKVQIEASSRLVDGLFSSPDKSTVKETVTQTEINDAKASIATIKQDKAKTSLLSYVQVADVYLDAKLKAEAEAKAAAEAKAKAEAEAKAQAEAEAKTKAKNNSSSSPKNAGQTPDLEGWSLYSTGDASLLLKYLLSGEVVKYNGQYWASPSLVDKLANPEVHVFETKSN